MIVGELSASLLTSYKQVDHPEKRQKGNKIGHSVLKTQSNSQIVKYTLREGAISCILHDELACTAAIFQC